MTNALVLAEYKMEGGQVLTADTVKNYLVSGGGNVTDQEVLMFIELCKAQGLNPFVRDAYLIKYSNSGSRYDKPAQIVIGKDFFIKKANEHPAFEGMKAGIVTLDKEGNTHEREGSLKAPNEEIIGGWCEVYRNDRKVPIKAVVSYEEYAQRTKDGQINSMWSGKPGTMIRKVAQSQALREAFPNELRGLYQQEELGIDGRMPEKPLEPGMASPQQKNKIMALAAQKGLFSYDNPKDITELEYFCESNGYNLKELKFEEVDEIIALLDKYEPVQDVEYKEVESDDQQIEGQQSFA